MEHFILNSSLNLFCVFGCSLTLMKFTAGHKTEHFKIILKYPVTRKTTEAIWAAKFIVENLFQGHEWLSKFWQSEQNGLITCCHSGISKLSLGESLPTTRDWRLEKWSLQRERKKEVNAEKGEADMNQSFSWILPAANCWFYFLSQLQCIPHSGFCETPQSLS